MAKRKLVPTLLAVGEGESEEAFLKHIKQFPQCRNNGKKITIKNAHGKGAAHVIDFAIRVSKHFNYDVVFVLFDTDTDWNEAVRKKAEKNKLKMVKSDPCLEAMLLRALGVHPDMNASLKKQFSPYINHDSTEAENYREFFHEEALQKMRKKEKELDNLLEWMGVPYRFIDKT